MLPIIWRHAAYTDFKKILSYIAGKDPKAAQKIKQIIESCILSAAEHPYMYRKSERIPGLREITAHPNYLIFYRVTDTSIEVINVVHARREFP
ncbi:MAG TPA: type II toxin-antitoxin system RelE/ParE family toxin [Xylella sp.]